MKKSRCEIQLVLQITRSTGLGHLEAHVVFHLIPFLPYHRNSLEAYDEFCLL